MTQVDILEWTMGWAWPVLLLFLFLMVWGITRLTNWGES